MNIVLPFEVPIKAQQSGNIGKCFQLIHPLFRPLFPRLFLNSMPACHEGRQIKSSLVSGKTIALFVPSARQNPVKSSVVSVIVSVVVYRIVSGVQTLHAKGWRADNLTDVLFAQVSSKVFEYQWLNQLRCFRHFNDARSPGARPPNRRTPPAGIPDQDHRPGRQAEMKLEIWLSNWNFSISSYWEFAA